jgi:hypothetical protein
MSYKYFPEYFTVKFNIFLLILKFNFIFFFLQFTDLAVVKLSFDEKGKIFPDSIKLAKTLRSSFTKIL